jgi:hypothetical protein
MNGNELAAALLGSTGIGNPFARGLLSDDAFVEKLAKRVEALNKADTIAQSTNLLWYDLSRIVQQVYPYRELIPLLSRLPRTPGDGGNAFHWKRITGINVGGVSAGVSEGNRGARIALGEQDMLAKFKTLGLESSTTFEARLGARNLSPEVLGLAVQATLRSLRINEEGILVVGNSSLPLGTTPTPTLIHGAVAGLTGSFAAAPVYIACVALAGFAYINYKTYNSTTQTGGVPGQVTKFNADGSSDTFGGGSAAPSAIATVTPAGTDCITATVTPVTGAMAYAWYLGTTAASPSTMYLAGLTPANRAVFTQIPASTNQPLSALYVGGSPQDNSTNILTQDGVLTQLYGAVTGPDPGRAMATNPLIPSGITFTASGAIAYTMASGNTGLTLNGSTINEFDTVFRTAWEQYKLGFDRVMMSATDMQNTFGAMLAQTGANNLYRLLFDADEETGRIVAGRKVTSYMNKFTNKVLDIETHPFLPPGTVLFWSDKMPYEVSGVANIIEAKVRQDYYQIQWPWRSRRYEYGVYVDEGFPVYFAPGFAVINNINGPAGNPSF